MYRIIYRKKTKKDFKVLASEKALMNKFLEVKKLIEKDPYAYPPAFEIMTGDMDNVISRRLSIKHRLVYTVDETNREIIIHSIASHYEF